VAALEKGTGGLKMLTVRELKKALEEFDDDEGVIIWFKWKGDSVIDSAYSLARNGNCIQIGGQRGCLRFWKEEEE
jgi:hypothetical protein